MLTTFGMFKIFKSAVCNDVSCIIYQYTEIYNKTYLNSLKLKQMTIHRNYNVQIQISDGHSIIID